MAVQVDRTKCAYIKGECNCSGSGQTGESCCSSGCDCSSASAKGCLGCAEVCPEGAITRESQQIIIDEALCTECGVCISACSYGALSL